MKPTNYLLVLFLCPILVFSQSLDYEKSYKKAIWLYKSGDYFPSMSELAPLTNASYANVLTPFAHYYYALSAQKLNRLAESRQMLMQLKNRFPNWDKIDDANYLMADLAFSDKKYGQAINTLQQIADPNIKRDAENLEKFYINSLKDITLLQNLNQQFSNDRIIAQSLANLSSTVLTEQLPTVKPLITNAFKKGFYNVAVLFPFRITDFTFDNKIHNNPFVYDLYDGMKLAQTKLQSEGITINFQAYDVANDVAATNDILNSPSFVQTDFVVGPLYNEPAKLIADFADINKIYAIHPTAITSELTQNHSNMFLLQPTLDRQAAAAFEFMKSQPTVMGNKIAIYYNNTRRDSTLANSYKTYALSAGYQVIDYRKVRERIDSTATISDRNRPSYVFVSSSVESDGLKVMAMMTKKRVSLPMVATAAAFSKSKLSASLINDKELYLIDNEFIDNSKKQTSDFQNQYFIKRNIIPSIHVLQGYDMMLFYGRMIHKYKGQLRNGLDIRTYQDDYLLQGFNYNKTNDNQTVTILKYGDMKFEKAN
jgi:ABC-type branched-subunit amino acid transport system substrate-binding protein